MLDTLIDWQDFLPDDSMGWPHELIMMVRRGNCVYHHHTEDWLFLISTSEDDLAGVYEGDGIQPVLAVNRCTGEVVHQTPGVSIEEWQAGLPRHSERYLAGMEYLRDLPVLSREWERIAAEATMAWKTST